MSGFESARCLCVTVKINSMNGDRCVSFLFRRVCGFIGSHSIHQKLREMVSLPAPSSSKLQEYTPVYLWISCVIYRPEGFSYAATS